MTPSDRQIWQCIRSKGRSAYILKYGILRMGTTAGIISTSFTFSMLVNFSDYQMDWIAFTIATIILIFFWGFILGAIYWHFQDRGYLTAISEDK